MEREKSDIIVDPKFVADSSAFVRLSSQIFVGIKSLFTRSKYKNVVVTPSKAVHTPIHHLIGRFQQLRTFHLYHRHLCPYIDAIKGKHNQVFLVSETYTWSLRDVVKQSQEHFNEKQIKSILFQLLDALVFLNSRQIVHRKLSLDNIMIDEHGLMKLADYGLYYMTKAGSLVAFPIGDPRYISPEAIAEGIVFSDAPDTPKSDVWSLGIVLFELISGGQLPWPQTSNTPFKVLLEILNLIGHEVHIDLQSAKLHDLESSDIEALRLKESGILARLTPTLQKDNSVSSLSTSSPSPTPGKNNDSNGSLGSNYSASAPKSRITVDARTRQHENLQRKARANLELILSCTPQFDRISPALKDILALCLTVDPMQRCTPAELLAHPYFSDLVQARASSEFWVPKPFTQSDLLQLDRDHPLRVKFERKLVKSERRKREELDRATNLRESGVSSSNATNNPSNTSTTGGQGTNSTSTARGGGGNSSTSISEAQSSHMASSAISRMMTSSNDDYNREKDPVNNITLAELFQLWCLGSGGDIEGELAPELKISPPILRIPLFVRSKENAAETVSDPDSKLIIQHHGSKDESRRYNDRTIKISIETLAYLAERNSNFAKIPYLHLERSQWPLEIREKDLEYQADRICMFRKLLEYYPETRMQIVREARKDVPPMLRAEIWAAILNVPSMTVCAKVYADIDKESEGPADKQIDLDVPRCHQYHELLSSPEGHYKLKRVLKAWVKYNPNWGYWQGVDSFLAPFLVQNFNNEALAFWCLQRAVEKFSRNLFDREQSVYLQEHLQIFKQLLSYHDPQLAMHLNEIGFQPALYAIPWFLTLFTQFFSLDQISRLWDRVLLDSSQLPFYLAYSMMKQLRDIILPLDFNACILLFSSLPGVEIDAFIKGAKIVAQETPSSITESNYKLWKSSTGENVAEQQQEDLPAAPKFNPNQPRVDRWWERQVPLEELQAELFPRLSGVDLASPGNFKFVVLDIRPAHAFETTSVPGSINLDASPQALASPTIVSDISRKLEQHHGAHFVVLGDRFNSGKHFANFLIECGVPRVSLLNGGIDALRTDLPGMLSQAGLPPLSSV